MSKFLALRAFLYIISRLRFTSLFQFALCTFGFLFLACDISIAQVTSDGTVNTQVNQNGNVAEITGGETRGGNLFHSFQDFSVETGNEAAFLNANDIANIFSRVTGGNISNIDGLISANGSANLFLINPAGIIFGENARLDVGGSFYSSSASSILFEDGEFSATDLENPPVLTINAPIGLGFRDQPGDIVNRASTGDGLEVEVGKNISLIGGNVSIEDGGIVFAPEGRIELGGLTESGIIGFTEDNNLSFPDAIARGDVSLTDSAIVSVSASVDDMASGQAGNIKLNTGSLTVNESALFASGGTQDRGGNVTIDATEDVSFANGSNVFVSGAEGGSIQLDAKSLSITSGSNFFNGISKDSGFAEAQSGDININATDNVVVDGQDGVITTISNSLSDNAIGNAGEINISARNISLTNGGAINSFVTGQGNSSDITLNARENISINGSNDSFNSAVNSFVQASGEGNSGITSITAQNLTLNNGGNISSNVAGVGDSGDININVKDSLAVDGEGISSIPSAINSSVGPDDAQGNSGDIRINTSKLSLRNGGQINASIFSKGNAGNIDINSTESITINGIGSQGGNFSGINSSVLTTAEGTGGNIQISTGDFAISNIASVDASTSGRGNGGEINITANNLSLTNGGSVNANTFGQNPDNIIQGNAGDITINIADTLSIAGTGTVEFQGQVVESPAGIFVSNLGDRIGNAGNIDVTANKLSLTNGSQINSATKGRGSAGNITINAEDSILLDKGNEAEISTLISTDVAEGGVGNGGQINLDTNNLSILNGAAIQNVTSGKGNAGSITINAQDSILISSEERTGSFSGILSAVAGTAIGNGGTINLTTNNLDILDGSLISARSLGEGNSGNIFIQANSLNLNGDSDINAQTGFGTGGNIQLQVADSVVLDNNSTISAEATNNANGGNLTIDSNFIVAFPNQNNDIIANAAQGNGGNITINAESVFGIEERPLNNLTNDINASSEVRGLDGTVTINTPDINPVQGATELPSNVIETEQTTEQACQANREAAARNNLIINGKGGIPPTPDLPLTSQNIIVIGQYTDDTYITPQPAKTSQVPLTSQNTIAIGQYTDDTYTTPEPIETSQGKIQLARGIKVSKDGGVILTAYPTNNAGERLPAGRINCGQI
ncbi:MAG: filamentous hemagglutinin N-terminal domain-containing protein [Waterburya sp.]